VSISTVSIPVISDERLLELYKHIKPIRKNIMGQLCWLREFDLKELREKGFLWDNDDIRTAVVDCGIDLRPVTTFRCLHKYDSPAVFRPKVAEVLAQIDALNLDEIIAFEVIDEPKVVYEINGDYAIKQAFREGYHTSVVQLYA
jgi:hypothetical protein